MIFSFLSSMLLEQLTVDKEEDALTFESTFKRSDEARSVFEFKNAFDFLSVTVDWEMEGKLINHCIKNAKMKAFRFFCAP